MDVEGLHSSLIRSFGQGQLCRCLFKTASSESDEARRLMANLAVRNDDN